MSAERKTPADLARRLGERANKRAESGQREGWRRKTYTLPRLRRATKPASGSKNFRRRPI